MRLSSADTPPAIRGQQTVTHTEDASNTGGEEDGADVNSNGEGSQQHRKSSLVPVG